MELSQLLDLADRCARVCLGPHARLWTEEDWEDAVQEAAVGILGASKRMPHAQEQYLYGAGKHQIYEWMRQWLRHPRGGTILDYLDYPMEEIGKRQTIDVSSLAPLLWVARNKGARHEHVEEDIRYLELILEGRSIAGIGMEMGLSRRRVYAIRERLLPRLEKIARGRGI